MAANVPVTLETLITVKIAVQGNNRKFKIPLKDLGAHVLPDKLRALLSIPSNQEVVFERYSDSAGAYITLDSENPQVYKTLFRAAKAKLKLRLRATIMSNEAEQSSSAAPSKAAFSPQVNPSRARLNAQSLSPSPVATSFVSRSPPEPRRSATCLYDRLATFNKAMGDIEKLANAQAPEAKAEVEEAPLPCPFPAPENSFANVAFRKRPEALAFRPKENASPAPCSWVVYCNNCDNPMANEHFHCSICDNGDYDLCSSCVDSGVHCPGAGHWMVKRFVKDGTVVNSTTERVGPKPRESPEKEMPGAFTEEKKAEEVEEPTRTCNSCVKVFPEQEFVTCTSCEDYDLCLDCHVTTKHGHHPGHAFKAATADTTLTALADFLCCEGRNVRHAAVCDGCEKFIYGVRHKCLNCPDWDFCSICIKSAKFIHPHHRFVPIYEPLPEPRSSAVRHYGIYCDGPLCKDKENISYIEGVRYKCAVCHDTDFCANCEAVPTNRHNRTHPLIKFKTPVRNVSVTTMGEDKNGTTMATMGDNHPARRSTATETVPVAPSANAATQVQTIVDLKPSEEPAAKPNKEKIEIKDLLAEPIQEKIKVQDLLTTPVPAMEKTVEPVRTETPGDLNAHFIRDTITDGTKVSVGHQFVQVWTLRNPGPHAWPAGCSVRFVGGDNMLNVDNNHPSSATDLAEATESNVIGRSVEVGEEIAFRVVMKAPKREGVAISYWRLKTADGLPFGHRLWCDIQVTAIPSPASTQQSPVPAYAPASHTSSFTGELNSTAQQQFQEQMMLLEAQNKRRLAAKVAQPSLETQESLPPPPQDPAERERFAHKIMALRQAALRRVQDQAAAKRGESSKASTQEEKSPVPSVPSEEITQAPSQELRHKGSQMIFPQLDKESPVSSTHEAIDAKPEAEETKSENATVAAPSEQSDEDFFEDAESVEIMDASSDDDDDGFMTDEEYDILNASDEEMP